MTSRPLAILFHSLLVLALSFLFVACGESTTVIPPSGSDGDAETTQCVAGQWTCANENTRALCGSDGNSYADLTLCQNGICVAGVCYVPQDGDETEATNEEETESVEKEAEPEIAELEEETEAESVEVESETVETLGLFAQPDQLSFPNIVRNTLAKQSVVLTNRGTDTVYLQSVTLATIPTSFTIYSVGDGQPYPQTITASSSVTVTVSFSPGTNQTESNSLNVSWTNAAKEKFSLQIPLSGTLGTTCIDITPQDGYTTNTGEVVAGPGIDFGQVPLNTPTTHNFTIKNCGTANLEISAGALGIFPMPDPATHNFSIGDVLKIAHTLASGEELSIPVSVTTLNNADIYSDTVIFTTNTTRCSWQESDCNLKLAVGLRAVGTTAAAR